MKIFFCILLLLFLGVGFPLLAKEISGEKLIASDEEDIVEESDSMVDKEESLKEREKKGKKKKGKRNELVQPSKKDDEDIIMYLD